MKLVYREKTTWQELYFMVMWLLALALYILIPTGSGLIKLIYYGIHTITIGMFFFTIGRQRISKFNFDRLLFLLGILIAIAFSALFSDQPITFSIHISGILNFLEMLFAIYIIDSLEHKKSLIRFLYWMNIIVALVFIALYFTSYAYSSKIIGSLTLGYSNPNTTAIYLLMNIAIIAIFFDRQQKFLAKIVLFSIGLFLFHLLFLTKSRMCLIAAILILVFRFFAPKWKLPKWTILPVQLLPLAFLFLYPYLYRQNQYSNSIFLNKELFSGREVYFSEMLARLRSIWLVGDFGAHPFTNAHNGPLAVLLGAGTVGYLAYFWFINSTIRTYHSRAKTCSQTIALIVIFAIFIHSCAEAAMTVGGANYSILLATVFWILKGGKEGEDYGEDK